MKSCRSLSRRLLIIGLLGGGLWEYGLVAGRYFASFGLTMAIATGTSRDARAWLRLGADPNFKMKGISMLDYALRNRDPVVRIEKLDALLKAGADPK